jgi:hypothetical protein
LGSEKTTECEITTPGIHLKVTNIERSCEFYESLGFKIDFAFGDEAFPKLFPLEIRTAAEPYRGPSFTIGDNLRSAFIDRIDKLGKQGGLILSPSHAVGSETLPDSVIRL